MRLLWTHALKQATRSTLALTVACGAIAAGPFATAAQARERLPLVASVDPVRYMGTWYEITKLPNFFQRRCLSDTRATYALRPDGHIQVTNRCRTGGTAEAPEFDTATGQARALDASNARLQVSFLPEALRWLPFGWGDYQVIALDADYRWVMVGEPGRKYLWILARQPQLAPDALKALTERARALGFPVDQLEPTSHLSARSPSPSGEGAGAGAAQTPGERR